jgi:hypothetical protein
MRPIILLSLCLAASMARASDSLDEWIARVAQGEPMAATVMQQYRHAYLHRCGGQVDKDHMALIVKTDKTFAQLLYFFKHDMKAEYGYTLATLACPTAS